MKRHYLDIVCKKLKMKIEKCYRHFFGMVTSARDTCLRISFGRQGSGKPTAKSWKGAVGRGLVADSPIPTCRETENIFTRIKIEYVWRYQPIILLALLLAMNSSVSHAQDYIYSLNQFTPLNFNPAVAGYDNDASVSFLNRATQVAPGITYKNNVFTGEYPFIGTKTGRRYGGIGFNFMQKDAGSSDLLNTQTLGLSLAYNLPIAANQYVSFGLQSVYYNKRTSLERLTTGSQWLAQEFRFDPNAALDEPLESNRINYFGINSGLLWYLEDKNSETKRAFVGVAAYNLNRPNESFFNNRSNIPLTLFFNAGAVVYQRGSFQLTPQLLFQQDNIHNTFNVLVSSKFTFDNENPYDIIQPGSLEILTKYDLQKDLSFGIVFSQPTLSIGFSYNFPLTSNTAEQYFKAGTEFGIRLTKTIWKVKPKQVEIETVTSVAPKRNFEFNEMQDNQAPAQSGAQQKSDTDIIQENIKSLSEVKALQFHLEKNFKFDFGRTELNDEAKNYLNNIYKLLQTNPDYKLEVIGHTDNVGKNQVNFKLSEGRAQAVADYLIQQGLDKQRVKFHGKGDKDPVAPNDTEENRSKNRRVEFLIYINK